MQERGRWRRESELKRKRKGEEVFNKKEMGSRKETKRRRSREIRRFADREGDNANYERVIKEREGSEEAKERMLERG